VNNSDNTNIEYLLSKFNGLHPDIHFPIEMETGNRLNFLECRGNYNLEFI
jgi:hypothetical protein